VGSNDFGGGVARVLFKISSQDNTIVLRALFVPLCFVPKLLWSFPPERGPEERTTCQVHQHQHQQQQQQQQQL
jgi:hypothetical protein